MTDHDAFDQRLARWFEADALPPAPAGGLDRLLDATRHRRPRPAWLGGLGSHWPDQPRADGSAPSIVQLARPDLRSLTPLAVLLLLVALAAGAILLGARLLQPSPLPRGHLAYVLDGDIYVADWDGRNPIRIADGLPTGANGCGNSEAFGQLWSPDGRHVAYRIDHWGDAPCRGTVVISDPGGNVVATVPGTGWNVAWSPDSTRVATWVDLSQTIGIYGLDGVRQALLTLPPGACVCGDHDPTWSRDGLSLLLRMKPDNSGSPSGIWELPLDGGAPLPLPADDPRQREPVYSANGTRLAFTDSNSLVIANADGTELRVLPGAPDGPCTGVGWATCGPDPGPVYGDAVLSPTGDRIAYTWTLVEGTYYDSNMNPRPRPHELRVLDVTTGNVTTLATDSELSAIGFSSQGDRILFRRTNADGADALWSVDGDGSHAQLLVAGTDSGDWEWLSAGR